RSATNTLYEPESFKNHWTGQIHISVGSTQAPTLSRGNAKNGAHGRHSRPLGRLASRKGAMR
ncbi:MAG TPA: hypothetical protein VF534_33730, partial [Paraburkholderia sp.]